MGVTVSEYHDLPCALVHSEPLPGIVSPLVPVHPLGQGVPLRVHHHQVAHPHVTHPARGGVGLGVGILITTPTQQQVVPSRVQSHAIHLVMDISGVKSSRLAECFSPHDVLGVLVHLEVEPLAATPCHAVALAPLKLQVGFELGQHADIHITTPHATPGSGGHHEPRGVLPDLGHLASPLHTEHLLHHHLASCVQLPHRGLALVTHEQEATLGTVGVPGGDDPLPVHDNGPGPAVLGLAGQHRGPLHAACGCVKSYYSSLHQVRLFIPDPTTNIQYSTMLHHRISCTVGPLSSSRVLVSHQICPHCGPLVVHPPDHHLGDLVRLLLLYQVTNTHPTITTCQPHTLMNMPIGLVTSQPCLGVS